MILVKDGTYQGFTFISKQKKITSFSVYEKSIEIKQDNVDIQRIINSYINNNSNIDILYA